MHDCVSELDVHSVQKYETRSKISFDTLTTSQDLADMCCQAREHMSHTAQ